MTSKEKVLPKTSLEWIAYALNDAATALPVLFTMLAKIGAKEGAMVADEILGHVKCAQKECAHLVEAERRAAHEPAGPIPPSIPAGAKLYAWHSAKGVHEWEHDCPDNPYGESCTPVYMHPKVFDSLRAAEAPPDCKQCDQLIGERDHACDALQETLAIRALRMFIAWEDDDHDTSHVSQHNEAMALARQAIADHDGAAVTKPATQCCDINASYPGQHRLTAACHGSSSGERARESP